mmetsp:Transcript_9085/g.20637  ORF Transcript_9085/g.20637 Transcript_9085/m.20637 type:complete len:500 (-) Transcript_9085:46-1545(-)
MMIVRGAAQSRRLGESQQAHALARRATQSNASSRAVAAGERETILAISTATEQAEHLAATLLATRWRSGATTNAAECAHQAAVLRGVDVNTVLVRELSQEERMRQGLKKLDAQDAPHGTRAIHRLVPKLRQATDGAIGECQSLELLLRNRLLGNALRLHAHDIHDLRLRQRVEHNKVIDTVDELGTEVPANSLHDALAALAALRRVAARILLSLVAVHDADATCLQLNGILHDLRRSEVARHDHHAVGKVRHDALRVRQQAVVEHLEEHVQHVDVRLLNLIEQQHAVRPAADRVGEQSTLVVAKVARRRADEARDRVLLHVLGHVESHEVRRPGGLEQRVRERLGELRLAHAGRSEEHERGNWAGARGRDVHAIALDRLRDRHDGMMLPDDEAVQLIVKREQLLLLVGIQLVGGDSRPPRNHLSDVAHLHDIGRAPVRGEGGLGDDRTCGRLGRRRLVVLVVPSHLLRSCIARLAQLRKLLVDDRQRGAAHEFLVLLRL